MDKTNVMRILDKAKIPYTPHYYDKTCTDGVSVAKLVGIDSKKVFKTLVTVSNAKEYFVFVIPVSKQLNLKKAAKAASVKSIEMIPQKLLLPLTGYIHGGCSPIGMKKAFKTFIDMSAKNNECICISAGKVGSQVELEVSDLEKIININFADLTE